MRVYVATYLYYDDVNSKVVYAGPHLKVAKATLDMIISEQEASKTPSGVIEHWQDGIHMGREVYPSGLARTL